MDTPETLLEPAENAEVLVDPVSNPVDAMLIAYQRMQMQNSHVSSLVASTLGISATDFRALLFIASAEGVTPKRTGDFLELTSGAITNLIDRMVAAGLVERTPHPNDRRSITLELAPAGVDAVSRVIDFYRRAFGTSVAPENVALLTGAFRAIGDALVGTAAADARRDAGA
jgi:DNA-binding MarR family transcriptional regulator